MKTRATSANARNTSSAALIHRQPGRPVGRASVVSCLVPRCFSFRHTNSGSARANRTEYDENPTSKQQLQSQDPPGSDSILRCCAGPTCVDFPYEAVCSELQ